MGLSSLSKKSLAMSAARFARVLDASPARERTTPDYLAEALRVAIYDGQFKDGEELNQVELASYFKVSRVPIREALRQLQAENLVEIIAHRRAVVVGLDLEEMLELIEIRAVLEGFLLEKAGPRLDAGALQRLNDLCDEADRIRDYGYNWVLKNWEFHRTLYKPSGSKAAIAMVEHLNLRVERYTGEPPLGSIKTFTLRGIKESPPFLHDGRCLTLEDTVEFFNLLLELKLSKEEKCDLVAFMRQL